MPKVNLESALYDRAKRAADLAGYSSVDEFIAHALENELGRLKLDEEDQIVTERLRGLGYLE